MGKDADHFQLDAASVSYGNTDALDRVSIDPIPGRDRVGLTTWNPRTVFHSLEFSKAGR